MIHNYIKVSLKDEDVGDVESIYFTNKSILLKYPCSNQHKCTPFVLNVSPGYFLFECWGSVGGTWISTSSLKSTPGYGGYTSGILYVPIPTTFYIYIGNIGFFNAVINTTEKTLNCILPGGATDVRLNSSTEWWDIESLLSRIMVAAGGGGSEWAESIGGNGGGIDGGDSTSAKYSSANSPTFPDKCGGAKQDSGTDCPTYTDNNYVVTPKSGTFGYARIPEPTFVNNKDDYGGLGGGGYYGGTSYGHAFAGSG